MGKRVTLAEAVEQHGTGGRARAHESYRKDAAERRYVFLGGRRVAITKTGNRWTVDDEEFAAGAGGQVQRRIDESDQRKESTFRDIVEAIGQLLEYAFAAERKGEVVRDLVVAGPGELQALDLEYLVHLQQARSLAIRYVCIRNGSHTLDP